MAEVITSQSSVLGVKYKDGVMLVCDKLSMWKIFI